MKYKIEFGFGAGEDASGRLLLQSEVSIGLQKICQSAADLYGGYTLTETKGGWKNPEGRLVEERGFELSVLAEYPTYEHVVCTIKDALRQQAVFVTIIEIEGFLV